MSTVLLILNLFVTLALIGVVLIQRSEGGGLGIGTSQGMGAFMSGRGTANLLTRTTAILAAVFFALCLILALLNRGTSGVGRATILSAPTTTAPISGSPSPGSPSPGSPSPGSPSVGTSANSHAPAASPAPSGAAARLPALPAERGAAPPASPAVPSVPTN